MAVTYLLPGISVDGFVTALVAALVLGLVNTVIRPILILLTLPVTLVTLGLFIFVINGLLFWFVGSYHHRLRGRGILVGRGRRHRLQHRFLGAVRIAVEVVLKDKLLDPASPVLLYGTTPPRAGSDGDAVETAAAKLAARLAPLPLDGVVVYDIQDESGRTGKPRPFAFTGTVDPRSYASLLAARTGKSIITYKCVGDLDEAGWRAWLDEAASAYGVGFLSIVGRPTSGVRYPLALSKAIRLAAAHRRALPWAGSRSPSAIPPSAAKPRACSPRASRAAATSSRRPSTTPTPASACSPTTRATAAARASRRGASCSRFAPVGREKTMAFLQLARRAHPARHRARHPRRGEPAGEIHRASAARTCAASSTQPYAREIPLGINVESVSINRDEIDASVDLFHALGEVLRDELREAPG